MPSQFWLDVRQGLLMIVAAIERDEGIRPQTSDLRREVKGLKRELAEAAKKDEQP